MNEVAICAVSWNSSNTLQACISTEETSPFPNLIHFFSLEIPNPQDLPQLLEPSLVHFGIKKILLAKPCSAIQTRIFQAYCQTNEIEFECISSITSNSSSINWETFFFNAKSLTLLHDSLEPALKLLCTNVPRLQESPLAGSLALKPWDLKEFMALSQSTASGLGLFPKGENQRLSSTSSSGSSLFSLLSRGCVTGPGTRLLESRLRQPSRSLAELNQRLDCVEFFLQNPSIRSHIQQTCLRGIGDLGKCLSKPFSCLETVVKCYDAASKISPLCSALQEHSNESIKKVFLSVLQDLEQNLAPFMQMVENTVDFEALSRHEYLIKAEFAPQLQQIHSKRQAIHEKINEEFVQTSLNLGLEAGKKIKLERSSQHSFHMRIARSEGWALREAGNSFIELATLKGGVLFCTEAMRNHALEYESLAGEYSQTQSAIVKEICQVAAGYGSLFSQLNHLIAKIDVSCALAFAGLSSPIPWTRPILGAERLKVLESRHPCIEGSVNFIPNSLEPTTSHERLFILTGPNAGGKSTFIRQIGIIAILAQIGSFVPCACGSEFPLFDRVLCRIGANDHLEKGVSTFMLEMIESAHLLASATSQSLVIIDELGRGTSTQDGFGLAWSIAQELAERIRCVTLFATHFHELTLLKDFASTRESDSQPEDRKDLVENLFVDAEIGSDGEAISFGYRVRKGVGKRSFGIEVAKICGFPELVLGIARDLADSFA